MKQRQFIHEYNKINRPHFNSELFENDQYAVAEALKKIILSIQRESTFVIRVLGFEIIEDYDDVNRILWQHEENIINKNGTLNTSKKRTKSSKINQYAFINLKETYCYILKIDYYIGITEKIDGYKEDYLTTYICIPRIVDKFYYKINGVYYSALNQIADASTYNNRTAKNSKKQSITFKTIFSPVRLFKYQSTLKTIDKEEVKCNYFITNISVKNILTIKYMLGKFGYIDTMRFLGLQYIYIVDDHSNFSPEDYYIFEAREGVYVVASRYIYNSVLVAQSFVYTVISVIRYMKFSKVNDFFTKETWIVALGSEMITKDTTKYYNKGIGILDSLELIYDQITIDDLHLPDADKADIYRVLRWMMYEFNALRLKDNLDISTKKVRKAEYIASLYAMKISSGIYRIADKGDRADINTVRQAINIPPMYLISSITKCNLINCKDTVNDNDAITALKYTYKGISGIGEKSNAVSSAYRSIHPSHLGRVDIDSSSNSDPGISGTICPLAVLYDGHFTEYEEPNTWRDDLNSVMQKYKSLSSKETLVRLINNNNLTNKPVLNPVISECISITKSLLNSAIDAVIQKRIDYFNNGVMVYESEEED